MSLIVNLTPHAITIVGLPVSGMPGELADWTLEPSGRIARANEIVSEAPPIGDIPTSRVCFSGVADIPEPEWIELPSPCDVPGAVPEGSRFCLVCGAQDGHVPGNPRVVSIYYVVSSIAADAARNSGRTTEDLLVPGQPVRDPAGRIIGCRSLARVS